MQGVCLLKFVWIVGGNLNGVKHEVMDILIVNLIVMMIMIVLLVVIYIWWIITFMILSCIDTAEVILSDWRKYENAFFSPFKGTRGSPRKKVRKIEYFSNGWTKMESVFYARSMLWNLGMLTIPNMLLTQKNGKSAAEWAFSWRSNFSLLSFFIRLIRSISW